MAIELRPYQHELLDKTRAEIRQGKHNICIQSPTGSGKTALSATMLGTASSRGHRCWFIVHRRELIRQTMLTFDQVGIKYGVIGPKPFPFDPTAPVQIASIQSLARRYDKLSAPKVLVWDECHHVAAGSWSKVHEHFPGSIHIGLSATPERLDGAGLDKWFKTLIQGPSVGDLIEQGYLAPFRLFCPGGGMDTSGLHTQMGDYNKKEVALMADRPSITGDAVQHYMKHAPGERALAFCASIQHSEHVAAEFNAAGIPAIHVDGETPANERDIAFERFERGDIRVMSNVELFGEGVDVPAASVAICLRPSKSEAMIRQQWGRVLRPCEGKDHATILDHAGNCVNMGILPDDDRQWTLKGTKGEKKSKDPDDCAVRICPKCFAALPTGVRECTLCGFLIPVKQRKIEERQGSLEENPEAIARRNARMEQGNARSMSDLLKLGRKRGYKDPKKWADHIMQARARAREKRAMQYGAVMHG